MGSDKFKQAVAKNQDILSNMVYHVLGEGKAQEMRGSGTGQGELGVAPRGQRSVGQGIMRGEAKAAMPARALGAENVPPVV
jgi:hypothetical protein